MGTSCEVTGFGVSAREFEDGCAQIMRSAEMWETTFSRFRPESELSRVNAAEGQSVQVSDRFLRVLECAIQGAFETEGKFDPTILEALEIAGYDRSIEFVEARPNGSIPATREARAHYGRTVLHSIEISKRRSTVQLPPEIRIDLGGIAKGAFVDEMQSLIARWHGGIVDAGGDMVVSGYPADGDDWSIGVQFPGKPDSDIATMSLPAGRSYGIATSSTQLRRWLQDDQWRNHLIDPASGLPVVISTPNVTVVADSATWAEIESKALLVALSRGESILPIRALHAIVAYEQGNYETYSPTETRAPSMDAANATASAA